MSGLWTAAAVIVSAVYGADQQRSANNKALDQQKAAAKVAARQAALQEEDVNKANARKADANAFLNDNAIAARKGVSGTILTGPGSAANALGGSNTLLGG